MKKLYIIFSFIFTCLFSSAQINFQSGFGDVNLEYGTKVVKAFNTDIDYNYEYLYCIIGPTGEEQIDASDVAIYFINPLGEMASSVKINLSLDEFPTGLVQTPDSGFLICGTTNSSPLDITNSDFFVLKINSEGDVLWSNFYGTANQDEAESIFKTPEGNYVVVGNSTNSNQIKSALVFKINENGDQIWSHGYTLLDGCYFYQGDVTYDNQYIFGGGFLEGNDEDNFIIKTDTAGNILWDKNFGTAGTDWISDIKTTSDSGFIIAGISTVNTAGGTDQCITKLDSGGSITWSYNYGNAGYDRSISVVENANHHYGVCGYTEVVDILDTIHQMVIEELDSLGEIVWSNIYGDSIQTCEGYYLINGIDDGFAAVGSSVAYGEPIGDVNFVKTDNSGSSGCFEFPLALTQNVPTFTEGTGANQQIVILNQQTANMISQNFTNTYAQNCFYDYIKFIADKNSGDRLINLYPNPTDRLLNIDIETDEANIIIYDQLSRKVFEQKIYSSNTSLDVSFLSPGFYILELRSDGDLAKGIFIKN